MINPQLVQLLESVLGRGIKLKKNGEYKFSCPAHTETHGPKLQVQLDDSESKYGSYNCWVCGFRGERLTSLFKKVNVSLDKQQELNHLLGIKTIKKLNKYDLFFKKDENKEYKVSVNLPEQFIPLWTDEYSWSPEYKQAKHYLLNKRKLTELDILRYRIGYAEEGQYSGMVIIPSYDERGLLNFYTGRTIYDNVKYKHKKPNVSNNIVGFELFANWKLPVVLCEGAFDAITIKNNAIPLFGKSISENLKMKLLSSDVPAIYFALDMDALKEGLEYAKEFMGMGKRVYIVELSGKDPNELGTEAVTEAIVNAREFNVSNLLKYKILNKI